MGMAVLSERGISRWREDRQTDIFKLLAVILGLIFAHDQLLLKSVGADMRPRQGRMFTLSFENEN